MASTKVLGARGLTFRKLPEYVEHLLKTEKILPNLVILHVGSNDVEFADFAGTIREVTRTFYDVADKFLENQPSDPKRKFLGIVYSETLPRLTYKQSIGHIEGQIRTRILNTVMLSLCTAVDSITIPHP